MFRGLHTFLSIHFIPLLQFFTISSTQVNIAYFYPLLSPPFPINLISFCAPSIISLVHSVNKAWPFVHLIQTVLLLNLLCILQPLSSSLSLATHCNASYLSFANSICLQLPFSACLLLHTSPLRVFLWPDQTQPGLWALSEARSYHTCHTYQDQLGCGQLFKNVKNQSRQLTAIFENFHLLVIFN